MSLSVWKASEADLYEHQRQCDTPLCSVCAAIEERAAWHREIADDERARIEAEQITALDEFERAEVERDMGLGDWEANDLREGEPGR